MVTHGNRANRAAALAVLALVAAGCSGGTATDGAAGDTRGGEKAPTRQRERAEERQEQSAVRLIGDGSTAYTGPQPGARTAEPLAPGEEPPQFVVFSWDGAGEDGSGLFERFRELGQEYDADMTFFLSGLYLLPESERERYHPPGRAPGASDIGYLNDQHIADTLEQVAAAWREGNEIGTHFNGHFCGADGVASWTPEEWRSEIEQAVWMVQNWRTTTGFTDMDPLPFDYAEELIGGRTPCLEGQDNLLRAAADLGFRYDSSGNGLQVWPDKRHGLWDVPLQSVPVPGHDFETLSMDYNFMYNQSGPGSGDPARHAEWGEEMRQGLMAAFDRALDGNRAPLIIGNHFESWNGGVYMDAVEAVIKDVCPRDGVECVSFRQLVDWLDAQDPAVLEKLRTLDVGEAPAGGWAAFLSGGDDGGDGAGAGAAPETEPGTEPDTEAGATAGT
ncbi:hypothetical protein [Streptomyces sp. RFCAC02]|uniref:hypothetical protein n=1 Tax=Streptomyces sp. RFCAC02 TaxID=2499143 RepID=UPI00101F08F5|nr:hypothetical protein [Streptomyces sp. RFCAC02]